MARAYVSVGSNIDRDNNIRSALGELARRYGVLTESCVYETTAIGFEGRDFFNLVVGFDTEDSPHQVAASLREIEARHGRVRDGRRFGSRTLDLDLILYASLVMDDGQLKLPRDEIHRYAFVLGPLAEIAGDERHPVTGERYRDMWDAFDASGQQLRHVHAAPHATGGEQ